MAVSRLRLLDLQTSRLPNIIGVCATDVASFADLANSAQERLLTCREAGETGWYGGYAEMLFTVNQDEPYLTLPRGVARLIKINACDRPMRIRNQFYEYLDFGDGRWPKLNCNDTTAVCCTGSQEAFRRNTVPTHDDLTVPGYGLRIYLSEADDVGKRVLVSCEDANGLKVTTEDDGAIVDGCFVTLASPFTDLELPGTGTPLEISAITGIQKDKTKGLVSIYEVNLTTSATNLILQMEPGERIAAYTRYYFNELPAGCCLVPGSTEDVQVYAMVKLDLIPVAVSTDYLLIQSREAMISEMQAIRLGDMDSIDAKKQARDLHTQAIRYLQGQLVHYEGKEHVAVRFSPFGGARLSNQRIGYIT